MLSYHDLHITTAKIPRTAISDLRPGLEVSCNRVGGWCLWDTSTEGRRPQGVGRPGADRLLAGEFDSNWLILDVDGHVIVDSRTGSSLDPAY